MKKLEDGQYMSVRREDGFVREQNTHMTRFHPFERRKTLFEKRQPPHGPRKQRWFSTKPLFSCSWAAPGFPRRACVDPVHVLAGSDKKRRWLPLERLGGLQG